MILSIRVASYKVKLDYDFVFTMAKTVTFLVIQSVFPLYFLNTVYQKEHSFTQLFTVKGNLINESPVLHQNIKL